MKFRADFFRREVWLGTGFRGPQWHAQEQKIPPDSLINICPKCGEPWATIEVMGGEWFPVRVPCEAHGGGQLLGSGWALEFVEAAPEAVLVNDILLMTEGMKDDSTWR